MFKKFLLLISLLTFGITFTSVPSFADDYVFDSGEQAIELTPTSVSSYTATGSAELSEGVDGSIQKSNFRNAIDSLEAAEVEIREEYAVFYRQYTEAKERLDIANAECKAIKKNLKEVNRKLKTVEKTKKAIFSNLPR